MENTDSSKQEELVSIRCRRHKKRFNVPREWVGVSKWLCPHCYESLTAEQRTKYAPVNGEAEVRNAEKGIPTYRPTREIKAKETPPRKPPEEKKEAKVESAKPESKPKKAEKPKVEEKPRTDLWGNRCSEPVGLRQTSRLMEEFIPKVRESISDICGEHGISPGMAALIPDWRMRCQKCKRTKPVQKSWLEGTSKVLCPECYAHLSSIEVSQFHGKHPEKSAEIYKVVNSGVPREERKKTYCEDVLFYGGGYSNETIQKMTRPEMEIAVRAGKLSKARARIEISRRKNAEYFKMLPDIEPVSFFR